LGDYDKEHQVRWHCINMLAHHVTFRSLLGARQGKKDASGKIHAMPSIAKPLYSHKPFIMNHLLTSNREMFALLLHNWTHVALANYMM
jgi:hypothetical protein